MTTRTYTQKDGTIWEWEENLETIEALKQLHQIVKKENEQQLTDS